VVERIVAKVNVIVTCAALVLTAFACVTRVVLRASICYSKDYTSTVASAVAATVILAPDLESFTAHCGLACRAATLA
jgi:hypothetical protein